MMDPSVDSGQLVFSLDETQFNTLMESLTLLSDKCDSIEKKIDNVDDTIKCISGSGIILHSHDISDVKEIVKDIKGEVKVTNSTLGASVDVPADYYSYMVDVSGQQVFFLSLILGCIIGLCFFINFIRK